MVSETTVASRPGFNIDRKMLRYLRQNTTSEAHINTGPRGAGKTLLMTRQIALALIICEWINNLFAPYLGTKIFKSLLRVWSNVPVSIMYVASQDGATWPGANVPKQLSSLKLNMHKLYAFDAEMQWGFVFIDELDQHADRQDWMNGGQKLFMKILVQIRKLHLSMTATIQSLNWINPRLMFQVDTTTACRDASVTGWGQANDLEPGTVTFLYTQDRSGRKTGYTYEESGVTYESQLYGVSLHDLYDTDMVENPWEHYESISVVRRKLIIDPNAQEELESYGADLSVISGILAELEAKGEKRISRPEYFKIAQGKGMVMNKQEALQYMQDVHNVRVYNKTGTVMLDLSHLKNIKAGTIGKRKIKKQEKQEGDE